MKLKYFIFVTFLFCSCSQEDASPLLSSIEITGRNEEFFDAKPLIYRIKVPNHWLPQFPASKDAISDTTKALVEFFIIEGDEKIRIAIHNFPSNTMEERIPPIAQINRWKKQFQFLDSSSVSIIPQAFGGYYGYLLEATGQMHDNKTSILGWALQIAPEHYRALSHPVKQSALHKQMRSDITIKAMGPEALIKKYREEMISSARSFQLIEDIP